MRDENFYSDKKPVYLILGGLFLGVVGLRFGINALDYCTYNAFCRPIPACEKKSDENLSKENDGLIGKLKYEK